MVAKWLQQVRRVVVVVVVVVLIASGADRQTMDLWLRYVVP